MRYRDREIRNLIRAILDEGLRKKRSDGERRITGSPRVTWARETSDAVTRISSHLDIWSQIPDKTNFEDISTVSFDPSGNWRDIVDRDGQYLSDVTALYPLGASFENVLLGNLSDMTGNPDDTAVVYAKVYCFYQDPRSPMPRGRFFAPKNSESEILEDPLTPEERRSGKIYAGKIEINLGTQVLLKYSESSETPGKIIAYRHKRERSSILRTADHETFHLNQYLSDRVLPSPGRYGRYGREGDRPGSESSTPLAGRREYTQSVALEPDAYVISIVREARERFMKWLRAKIREADSDDVVRNKILDKGYRTDAARGFVEWHIEKEMSEKKDEKSDFSGAGNSQDVRRYIRMRSLNAIDAITRSGDRLVASELNRWLRKGWKRKPYTPYLDAERKRKMEDMQDTEFADSYIADVEHALERMDKPMLDALASVAGSIDEPDDTGPSAASQFFSEWYANGEDRKLMMELVYHFMHIDDIRERYTGTRPDPKKERWISSYISDWVIAVKEDIEKRGLADATSDPLIPSRGAVIEDVEIGIRFEDYRGKNLPESFMRSLIRSALLESTREITGEFSSNPVELAIVLPEDPDYTQDSTGKEIPYIHLLGTMPDIEIAERFGVPTSTVWLDRKHRGIPSFTKQSRRDAVEPIIQMLGTKPDEVLADEFDIPIDWIARERKMRGIPAAQREKPPVPFAHLLGTMPDGEIARQFGVSRPNVVFHRKKLGIPPFAG